MAIDLSGPVSRFYGERVLWSDDADAVARAAKEAFVTAKLKGGSVEIVPAGDDRKKVTIRGSGTDGQRGAFHDAFDVEARAYWPHSDDDFR
jgi:hypothetical protein